MTYLQMVNEVLLRLREDEVLSISQSTYAQLVGRWVNDSKRQVENAWPWDALATTKTLTTTPGTATYVVTGSGRKQRDVTVNHVNNNRLANVPARWIEDQQQLTTVQTGQPCYYAWDGTDGTDNKMTFYPTPDGAYTIKVNMIVPQVDLSADADVITIVPDAVIAGAYARAIAERGEDGGLSTSEAYALYRSILADTISLEASRQDEFECWAPV